MKRDRVAAGASVYNVNVHSSGQRLMTSNACDRRTFAEEVAREAGGLALSYFRRNDLNVQSKGELDWVTQADVETEELIRQRIGESFPDDRILGEEGGDHAGRPGAAAATWVVDPIDGTTCFVSGLPGWSVSIACLDAAGHLLAGVVHDPPQREMFSAAAGDGLLVNGTRVVAPRLGLTDGYVAVGHSRKAPSAPIMAFLESLLDAGGLFYNPGSAALSLAYVAAGRLTGFFEADLRSWDELAGELLVRESGGWVTEFMRDGSLTTSKPVLAANAGSTAALRDLVAHVLDEDMQSVQQPRRAPQDETPGAASPRPR